LLWKRVKATNSSRPWLGDSDAENFRLRCIQVGVHWAIFHSAQIAMAGELHVRWLESQRGRV